jgi:hypothetical protein
MTKVSRGKMDEGWNHAIQAKAIGEKYGYNEITTLSLRTIGDIYRYLGNDIQAMEYYQKALETSTDSFLKCDSLSRLGYLKCLNGDDVHGLPMIQEAIIESERMSLGTVAISSHLYLYTVQNTKDILNINKNKIIDLLNETENRGLVALKGVCLGLLASLDYSNGEQGKAEEKIVQLLKIGEQFEGLWASVLIQILYDADHRKILLTNEYWRTQVQKLLIMLENNCKNPALRHSFILFKTNIDKIISM